MALHQSATADMLKPKAAVQRRDRDGRVPWHECVRGGAPDHTRTCDDGVRDNHQKAPLRIDISGDADQPVARWNSLDKDIGTSPRPPLEPPYLAITAVRPTVAAESRHGVAATAALGAAGGVKAERGRAGALMAIARPRDMATTPPPPPKQPPTAMPDRSHYSCHSSLQHRRHYIFKRHQHDTFQGRQTWYKLHPAAAVTLLGEAAMAQLGVQERRRKRGRWRNKGRGQSCTRR